MSQSQTRVWRLIAIASWCGVLSSAFIAFVICILVGFSLIRHNEPLLFTIPRTMTDEIHVVLDGGQLQIGTQTDVPQISDWIGHIRAGTADFGYPVTGTYDFQYGPIQLSWIRFAGSDPTFGFACPFLALLVPLVLVAWAMHRLGRYAFRRTNPDDGWLLAFGSPLSTA